MIKAKHIISVLIVAMMIAATSGCSRPKSISDEKLTEILKDFYVINAYAKRYPQIVQYDSVDIYEPVLQKYGYTSKDFIHTIETFSKRKSARLSNIIEVVIDQLDDEFNYYVLRTKRLDYIDSLAFAVAKKTVYFDPRIEILNGEKDRDKMKLSIPAEDGRYEIRYYYQLDSTDKNPSPQNRHLLYDSTQRIIATQTTRIKNNSIRILNQTKLHSSPEVRRMEIVFGAYPNKIFRSEPNLVIDSLEIVWYPNEQEARNTLVRHFLPITPSIDEPYENKGTEADSSSLYIPSPLIVEERDSIAVR